MDVMGTLTSDCTQLFEAVIQCVRTVVSLVDDSAMLKRGTRTVDGTSVDIGAACEFGRSPRGVEVVAHTEGAPGNSSGQSMCAYCWVRSVSNSSAFASDELPTGAMVSLPPGLSLDEFLSTVRQ
jgi:hypothetical protein